MVTTPKVLIIDDSNTECVLMGQALQQAGYQVLIANDGVQGLRLLSQESPQCLVLDIVLPGMSGYDVCRQLRSKEMWRNLPIVIVSTRNSSADMFWAKRQGANQYLPKPFKGEVLAKVVDELLGKRPQPQASGTDLRTGTMPGAQGRDYTEHYTLDPSSMPRSGRETPPTRPAQTTAPFPPLPHSGDQFPPQTMGQSTSTFPPEPASGTQHYSSGTYPNERQRNSDAYPAMNWSDSSGVRERGDAFSSSPSLPNSGVDNGYRTTGSLQTPPAFQGIPGLTDQPSTSRGNMSGSDLRRGSSPTHGFQPNMSNTNPGQSSFQQTANPGQGFQQTVPNPNLGQGFQPGQGFQQGIPNNMPTSGANDMRSRPVNNSPAQNLFMALIPRHNERFESQWHNSTDALFIDNPQARQLYMAIDGKSDVGQLCIRTGMVKEDVFKALSILVSQQRIQLFDAHGRKMDGFFLQ